MAMAAEIGIASGEKGFGIKVSSAGVKIGPKGRTRGGPSLPGGLVVWPRVGPRHQGAPVTGGPLRFHFGDSGSFSCSDFLYNFPGFIGHFNYWKNLKYKNSRKQK